MGTGQSSHSEQELTLDNNQSLYWQQQTKTVVDAAQARAATEADAIIEAVNANKRADIAEAAAVYAREQHQNQVDDLLLQIQDVQNVKTKTQAQLNASQKLSEDLREQLKQQTTLLQTSQEQLKQKLTLHQTSQEQLKQQTTLLQTSHELSEDLREQLKQQLTLLQTSQELSEDLREQLKQQTSQQLGKLPRIYSEA